MQHPLYLIAHYAMQFVFGEFHPDLIGLTATTDKTRKVDRVYRVYEMKTEDGSGSLVGHLIIIYVTLVSNSYAV